MPEPAYSDAEIDAALQALNDPTRLHAAQDLVAQVAPQLQHVLVTALESGGWFGPAHEAQVQSACDAGDPEERMQAVRTLIAEETRMGMLVGVAVGYQLARELKALP